MLIELLCDNCKTCSRLKNNIDLAMKKGNFLAEVALVNDPEIFVSHGIMSLPGIVIDGQLRSEGRLLSVEEIITMITAP